MGKVDELNDGLTEDDPDWVLPWAEEEDPSGEPGKTIWVRRRKADGEIIKRSEEVPDVMLSKEELNKKQVAPTAFRRTPWMISATASSPSLVFHFWTRLLIT